MEELADGTWNIISQKVSKQLTTGWRSTEPWYYFGHDIIMQTGWVKDDGNWYYMDLEAAPLYRMA